MTRLALLAAAGWLAAGSAPAADPTDAEKLKKILAGANEFPRAERIKRFAKGGPIDAVGTLVEIGGKVYFKTADQSYIPEKGRFPYPEMLYEVHTTEGYAYRPLTAGGYLKGKTVTNPGPVRVVGNWAYEAPYHIFGLVWVDAARPAAGR